MCQIKRFMNDDRGLETVEYAIILGLVVAGTIGLVAAIGAWVQTRFQDVADEIGAGGD